MPNIKPTQPNLFSDIKNLIIQAKKEVYSSVNTTMTQTYWNIGKRIVEEEQEGKERAEYEIEAAQNNLSFKNLNSFLKG